jgi:hypothetical protein
VLFCAFESNHMTVNTRAVCRIYQQNLKFKRFRGLEYQGL